MSRLVVYVEPLGGAPRMEQHMGAVLIGILLMYCRMLRVENVWISYIYGYLRWRHQYMLS